MSRTCVSIGVTALSLAGVAGLLLAAAAPPAAAQDAAAVAAGGSGAQGDQPECMGDAEVPNPAVNCPDRFAWQVFVEVNAPAGNGTGQTVWQTWSTDDETFPCPPTPSECGGTGPPPRGCPVFPGESRTPAAAAGHQRSARAQQIDLQTPAPAPAAAEPPAGPPQTLEIVHRNRPTFDYIVANDLWYVEGLEKAFEDGFVFDFPTDAIEFKSNWRLLAEGDDPARYHTMVQDGSTYLLVAFHVSTKDLPNWFWSTFEHVDNPGRCDFIGCHDSFGVVPHDVPPHPKALNQQYPPGELTAPVQRWLAKLAPAFQNYRLKGSQTDYTTPTGLPTLLGNSVTEAGFVQTASCITCHGRATIGASGTSPYPTVAGLTPDFQSFNGPPRTEWYYSNERPLHRWSVQTDFVWAIPFKANSIDATETCCAQRETGGPPACQD